MFSFHFLLLLFGSPATQTALCLKLRGAKRGRVAPCGRRCASPSASASCSATRCPPLGDGSRPNPRTLVTGVSSFADSQRGETGNRRVVVYGRGFSYCTGCFPARQFWRFPSSTPLSSIPGSMMEAGSRQGVGPWLARPPRHRGGAAGVLQPLRGQLLPKAPPLPLP